MKRRLFCLLGALLMALGLAQPAGAFYSGLQAVYHDPMVTILVESGPEDLELEMILHRRDGSEIPVELEKRTIAWEQQFRLYRELVYGVKSWFGNDIDLLGAELVLHYGGQELIIPLEQSLTDQLSMDDELMLDFKAGTLKLGQPFWRGGLLMILRILLSLAALMLIFRLRGYEAPRSFLCVGLGGLISYLPVHLLTKGWLNHDEREIVVLVLVLGVTLLLQLLTLVFFIDEDDRDRTMVTTLLANVAAVAVSFLTLNFLPV